MKTTLFVSPHFDDAVLSCAGTMIARRAAGHRVIVCSVFTRGPSERARSIEDQEALGHLDAEPRVLGLADAPTRERVPASFESLVLHARVRRTLAREVGSRLARTIRETRADEVWLPLGIGGHVDHLTVFEAGLALAPRRRYYVERPYGFVPLFRALRGRELAGGARRAIDVPRIETQLTLGGCGAMVSASERTGVLEALRRRLARPAVARFTLRFVAIHHPISRWRRAMEAIAAYRSQLVWLLGSADPSRLWRAHARRDGHWLEHEARLGDR